MLFNFKSYAAECAQMSAFQLQREWQKYTRSITSAATSAGIAGVMFIPTLGVSSVGFAFSAPAIHNARKKRKIIEETMLERWARVPETRKRDIIAAVSLSATINGAMMGVGDFGVSQVASEAVVHSWAPILAHPDALRVGVEFATGSMGSAIEEGQSQHHEKRHR